MIEIQFSTIDADNSCRDDRTSTLRTNYAISSTCNYFWKEKLADQTREVFIHSTYICYVQITGLKSHEDWLQVYWRDLLSTIDQRVQQTVQNRLLGRFCRAICEHSKNSFWQLDLHHSLQKCKYYLSFKCWCLVCDFTIICSWHFLTWKKNKRNN